MLGRSPQELGTGDLGTGNCSTGVGQVNKYAWTLSKGFP